MHSTNQTNRTNKNSCIANTRPFQLTGWLTWANQNTRGHLQHILRQNTHIWTHLLLHSHIPQGRGVPWASDPAQYLAHVGWKVPPKRLCVCVCVCVCVCLSVSVSLCLVCRLAACFQHTGKGTGKGGREGGGTGGGCGRGAETRGEGWGEGGSSDVEATRGWAVTLWAIKGSELTVDWHPPTWWGATSELLLKRNRYGCFSWHTHKGTLCA